MPKKNTDHIIVVTTGTDDGHFKCNHCGKTQAYKLPIRVDVWVSSSQKFVKDHADCQPPEKSNESEKHPISFPYPIEYETKD